MPELPEVETIARQLDSALRGRTIKSVTLLKTGREAPTGKKFTACLEGKKIQRVVRRAKLLIWEFTDGSAVLAHLKMTGRFVFADKTYQPAKHDRAIFEFVGAHAMRPGRAAHAPALVWSDIRQFGFMRCVSKEEKEKTLAAYGPEPLEASVEDLAARLEKPKTRKIKSALLDQATLAGIGNIYADEALFRAGIRPTRRLANLTRQDRLRLAREIKILLKESIRLRGTSASDYVDASGAKGSFEKHLRVYGRGGEKCLVCGRPIKRMVLNQRGTHYCPRCQK